MSRIFLRRITIAAALAALLVAAAPAQAAAWNGGSPQIEGFQSAWQWLAAFWAPLAPARHTTRATKSGGGTQTGPSGAKADRGVGIDPNGGTTSSTTPCQVGCERSGGIDPNG
jgi:hypothetical protein